MKLLNHLQNKDRQQEEVTRKIIRTQEVEDLANKANIKLAKAEQDFALSLARNRAKWAQEEEEHANRLKDMLKEIEALEKRKQQALIPISIYKEEADKMMEEAKEYLIKAKGQKEENEYTADKLEEKLSDVADRENQVSRKEEGQKIALQGIEFQKEQAKKGIEKLSEEMIMFHEKREREEASLLQRKKEVTMAEISFNAKVEKYQRDLQNLASRENELRKGWLKLDKLNKLEKMEL
jgi:hypothetical protein